MADAWIVAGESGEYSDWTTWPVAVFARESDAEAFAAECNRLANGARKAWRDADYFSGFNVFAKAIGLDRLDWYAADAYCGVPKYSVIKAPWFRGGFVEATDGE